MLGETAGHFVENPRFSTDSFTAKHNFSLRLHKI